MVIIVSIFLRVQLVVFEFANTIALLVKDLLKMSKTHTLSIFLVVCKPLNKPGGMLDERFHRRVNLSRFQFIRELKILRLGELVHPGWEFMDDLVREIVQEVVQEFGNQVDPGELLDVGLNER